MAGNGKRISYLSGCVIPLFNRLFFSEVSQKGQGKGHSNLYYDCCKELTK